SRYPAASASLPSFSCTAARALHAAHQSSQRSSAPVTSSKSASSTPFDTKRGAQWAMAAATRGSGDFVFAATSDMRMSGRDVGTGNRILLDVVAGTQAGGAVGAAVRGGPA